MFLVVRRDLTSTRPVTAFLHHLQLACHESCSAPLLLFFFSSRRRHTRLVSDWSSDVCSSDLRMWLVPTSSTTFHGRCRQMGHGTWCSMWEPTTSFANPMRAQPSGT